MYSFISSLLFTARRITTPDMFCNLLPEITSLDIRCRGLHNVQARSSRLIGVTDPDALDDSASVDCSREGSRGKAESSEDGGEVHFDVINLGWSWEFGILLKELK